MILFCLPHAGASASIYYRWDRYLDTSITVRPLELNGRGELHSKPFYRSISEMTADLAARVQASVLPNEPFAIFGHSMGAYAALSLGEELENRGVPPQHVFVSGRASPVYRSVGGRKVASLPDLQFIQEVAKYGGIHDDIKNDTDILAFFLPILRADFALVEKEETKLPTPFLKCPITVMNGVLDVSPTDINLSDWQNLTSGTVSTRFFPGGHFYLNDDIESVTDAISEVTSADEGNEYVRETH
ncbi:thioesterase II family protein [Glutamicibacter ardleyensis]|uniref:thioesterase II family protein n=1 Tax=Glutamicibacter ardleyensis TaxID=225894 RepID=UPI003FCFCD8B